VPWKDEPGIENQIRALSEEVQITSEKLGTLTSDEKTSIMLSK
jgi:hypothetical protein